MPEAWVQDDILGLLLQLGALPPAPAADQGYERIAPRSNEGNEDFRGLWFSW